MIFHYLDASAWVKRYAEEPGTRWVSRFFSRGPTVGTATLGLIELLAAFARKQRAGEMTPAAFSRVCDQVEADFEQFVQVDFGPDVLAVARGLPSRYALRGADAVHLATAMHVRDSLAADEDEVVMVTCDVELGAAARLARFPVIDPEEEEARRRR